MMMSRMVCLVAAASLALAGVQCFLTPFASQPGLQQRSSAAAEEAQAQSAVQELEVPQAHSAFSPLAFGAALGLLVAVMGSQPALAADVENGESVFTGNCAACHSGGNNAVVPEKKIKKEALVTYGKYSIEAIITQVTKGYGAMPAFGEKLGPDDIEDVANYVYGQADKWP